MDIQSINDDIKTKQWIERIKECRESRLLGTVDNYYNYAFINNTLHRRIHTKLYYQSIWLNFSKVYAIKNDINKGIVRSRLLNYKIVLEGISYLGA